LLQLPIGIRGQDCKIVPLRHYLINKITKRIIISIVVVTNRGLYSLTNVGFKIIVTILLIELV